ncbi:MAG: hypothetical protein K6T30_07235, partial [Alicyclobacillus sp.]|nr:hypothetical protein [Alicyclobacillus sp.]
MRSTAITRQLIAFVAAGVIVFTGIDVFILWRNQSAERVMGLGAGQLVYQTADLAIGVTAESPRRPNASGQAAGGSGAGPDAGALADEKVTLLRFTPDGGWVIAGSGHWLSNPAVANHALVAVIPSNSVGVMGGGWLCAVQKD